MFLYQAKNNLPLIDLSNTEEEQTVVNNHLKNNASNKNQIDDNKALTMFDDLDDIVKAFW
jgi:hypothetical protein